MTLTRSRIISDASGYAGEPPDEPIPAGIPEWMRYSIAADLEVELLRDLNLSAENRTLSSYPLRLQPGNREFTVSQADLENASFATLTYSSNPNANPVSLNVTNLSLLNGIADDGDRAIAFYSDRPQRGMVSWIPSGDEVITIWYDRSPNTDPSPEQSTFSIAASYVPFLKLLLAAQMLELMNKPIGEMLKARISNGTKQWKKFVRQSKQQGIVQKTSWRPDRYGSAGIPPFWPPGTRFE
jgi:hypothetical protein